MENAMEEIMPWKCHVSLFFQEMYIFFKICVNFQICCLRRFITDKIIYFFAYRSEFLEFLVPQWLKFFARTKGARVFIYTIIFWL